ncbi:MAG: hypothetical protein A4E63_00887 [Syntrophorhabdus sp. PtaU1.Bin050]|nr:MAG: hypothetical protein A4E63_00887 [Syntrophorhabdus sp. PtaU1.Bin050]
MAYGGYPFVLFCIDQVDYRPPLGGQGGFRDSVDLDRMCLACVGKEKQVRVGGCDVEVIDNVFFPDCDSYPSLPAAQLVFVLIERSAFNVSFVSDGDRHLFFFDQILNGNVRQDVHDLCKSFVAVLFLDLQQLFFNEGDKQLFVFQYLLKPRDLLGRRVVVVNNLGLFERGESLEAHFQDACRLFF